MIFHLGKCTRIIMGKRKKFPALTMVDNTDGPKGDRSNLGTWGNYSSKSIPYFWKEWQVNADNPK